MSRTNKRMRISSSTHNKTTGRRRRRRWKTRCSPYDSDGKTAHAIHTRRAYIFFCFLLAVLKFYYSGLIFVVVAIVVLLHMHWFFLLIQSFATRAYDTYMEFYMAPGCVIRSTFVNLFECIDFFISFQFFFRATHCIEFWFVSLFSFDFSMRLWQKNEVIWWHLAVYLFHA